MGFGNPKEIGLCELLYLLYACSFANNSFCLNIGVTTVSSS